METFTSIFPLAVPVIVGITAVGSPKRSISILKDGVSSGVFSSSFCISDSANVFSAPVDSNTSDVACPCSASSSSVALSEIISFGSWVISALTSSAILSNAFVSAVCSVFSSWLIFASAADSSATFSGTASFGGSFSAALMISKGLSRVISRDSSSTGSSTKYSFDILLGILSAENSSSTSFCTSGVSSTAFSCSSVLSDISCCDIFKSDSSLISSFIISFSDSEVISLSFSCSS